MNTQCLRQVPPSSCGCSRRYSENTGLGDTEEGTRSGSGSWRRQGHGPAGPPVWDSPDRALAPCLWHPSFPFLANPLSCCFPGFLRTRAGTPASSTGPSLHFYFLRHGCISLVSTSLPLLEPMVAAPVLCLFGRARNPFPFPHSLLICGGLW